MANPKSKRNHFPCSRAEVEQTLGRRINYRSGEDVNLTRLGKLFAKG